MITQFNNICIDFGTCNSVISYYDSSTNQIRQIMDEINGDVLIPSTIFFVPEELKNIKNISELEYQKHYFIGYSANSLYSNSSTINKNKNYFYQFKRFLGMNKKNINFFSSIINKLNFNYHTNDDYVYFTLESLDGNELKISIIDLIKYYLTGLKSYIKNQLNLTQNLQVIITCPAYFHDLQRTQLKKAFENAGYDVFRMNNEPTSAAIYYINTNSIKENKIIIIYDVGGGTIDTTVISYIESENTCEVLDIDGNNCLGGIDIDNLLVDDIYYRYSIDKNNKKWYTKIRNYAEEIKNKLSFNSSCTIYLEDVPLITGITTECKDVLKIIYSRHQFNSLVNDLIEKMVEPIKNMYSKYDVSNLLLIGGPTQIPLVQNKISSFLKNTSKIINNTNNFSYKTIVSQGGTLFYKLIVDKNNFCLLDITPMNIGISDTSNSMIVMIEKNTKIPTSIEKTFSTTYDCQRVINIEVFEGIFDDCLLNSFIGSYKIIGIPPLPRGSILIKLLFKISYNGILNIIINGYKNSSDESGKSFDFKIAENIKLISSSLAKELLKKILMSEKK